MRIVIDIIYSNQRRNELADGNLDYCETTRNIVNTILIDAGYDIIDSYNEINHVGVGDMTFVIDFTGTHNELKELKKLIKVNCDNGVRAICIDRRC